MRLTSIDIGTNTVLMLIADLQSDGSLSVIRDEHVIARLGKGVDAERNILPETFERILKVLTDFKKISELENSNRILACATSALRDAGNRKEFREYIAHHTGIDIRILSGEQEASMTYMGAVSEFLGKARDQFFAVLDIGGGSTELTIGKSNVVTTMKSVDVGSVRLTERFLGSSPPNSLGVSQAQKQIRDQLPGLPTPSSHAQIIGVAGTLTTLAAMDLQLAVYDRTKVSGHVLSFDTVQTIFNQLRIKTLDEIRRIPQILPERADIILAGILILLETMKHFGFGEITVSDRGLRFGILQEEAAISDE